MSAIWLTFRNFFLGKRESGGYCRYFDHKINKLTSASSEGRQRKIVVCLFVCFFFFTIILLVVRVTAITKGKTPVPVCSPKLSPVGRG